MAIYMYQVSSRFQNDKVDYCFVIMRNVNIKVWGQPRSVEFRPFPMKRIRAIGNYGNKSRNLFSNKDRMLIDGKLVGMYIIVRFIFLPIAFPIAHLIVTTNNYTHIF